MGSVVIYPPSPDILQRSRERAVKGRNARRLRRLALDGLARLCYFRQGGGGISSRAASFPMNGKGRGIGLNYLLTSAMRQLKIRFFIDLLLFGSFSVRISLPRTEIFP